MRRAYDYWQNQPDCYSHRRARRQVSRDETGSVLKGLSQRDLETELLGALCKGEQSRVTVSLSLLKREGPSTGPRRRRITGLPQWSALPSQSIAKDQPSNTSRPQSRRGPKQRPTLTTTQWTPRGRPTVRGDSRSTTWLPEMGLRCVLNDWDSYWKRVPTTGRTRLVHIIDSQMN